jgi:hypothetical protein
MATFTLILFIGLLSFVIAPWVGNLNHFTLHKTDLMAGGEGE